MARSTRILMFIKTREYAIVDCPYYQYPLTASGNANPKFQKFSGFLRRYCGIKWKKFKNGFGEFRAL